MKTLLLGFAALGTLAFRGISFGGIGIGGIGGCFGSGDSRCPFGSWCLLGLNKGVTEHGIDSTWS